MTKNDHSPVTVADYGSQAIICRALQKNFPNDPVVGEEDASDLRLAEYSHARTQVTDFVRQTMESTDVSSIKNTAVEQVLGWIDHGNGKVNPKRYWTLDPIDGTKGFVRGDQYAICLALVEEGDVKVGVLGCPALELDSQVGYLFTAVRGEGTVQQSLDDVDSSKRISVSPQTKTMVQSFEASHGNHQAQQETANALGMDQILHMDSQAKYAMVASGHADLYLRLSNYSENIWDHAAGSIVVEEAGGRVTDRKGRPLQWDAAKMTETSGVVVSNGAIHESAIASLASFSSG